MNQDLMKELMGLLTKENINTLFRNGVSCGFGVVTDEKEMELLVNTLKSMLGVDNGIDNTNKMSTFSVGDKIQRKGMLGVWEITDITEKGYYELQQTQLDLEVPYNEKIYIFEEYAKTKFKKNNTYNVKCFEFFDKVIVRDSNYDVWHFGIFSHYDEHSGKFYLNNCKSVSQWLPYNEYTKNLIGTTQTYHGLYKTW